ncbi:cilia- and flagella-associated protein 251 [Fagus crenata]
MNFVFLNRVTQLLLSVSLFSFFFTHSYLLSFLQPFNFYFSTFPLQLFSHTLDKNYIFLLCNGLLVFLAKYSGLIRSLSGAYHNEESFKSSEDDLQKEVVTERSGSAANVAMEQGREIENFIKEVQQETHEKSAVDEEKEGGEESRSFISKQEEDEKEQKELVNDFFIEETVEEEEEEEEGNGILSTEELNKKFDDFIRRMKEGIRIEAQQQLVMV